MNAYVIGQIWISETEPELGVCRVVALEFKRLSVFFSGPEETRIYSLQNAPLKRVRFSVGDTVVCENKESFAVKSVREDAGLLYYFDGNKEIPETALDAVVDFSDALARMKNIDIDPLEKFDLRYETLRLQQKVRQSGARGLHGARMELIPHQLYVANEIISAPCVRALLADEVGLGKTIEACLVMHRLLVTGQICNVLILLPDSLIHQWFIELYRRFNLAFSILDEERKDDFEEDSALLICGIDFLAANPSYAQKVLDSDWDMMIVDEAHHLEWTRKSGGSVHYNLVKLLAEAVDKVILLSGTPEQLGVEGHFARLRLLDPTRYYDFDAFMEEQKHYSNAAKIADKLIAKKQLTKKEQAVVSGISSGADNDDALKRLLDQYGTGRAIYRNTRHVAKGFPERIATLVKIPQRKSCASSFLESLKCEFEAGRERKDDDLKYDYSSDPRITWLLELLVKLKDEKVLLICRSKEKASEIKRALQAKEKIEVALFHEDMTIMNRDREAAWFSQKDGARILICSEIGSEGRNFQFSRHLVLYDLPTNPELLEQRIGRLARIGQKESIYIYLPYIEGSPQELMARWYNEGLNAIEKHLPGGHEFLRPFAKQIQHLATVPRNEAEVDALIFKTRKLREELVEKLEKGRDHLLELNSFNPEKANEIVDAIKRFDHDHGLEEYILKAFEQFGINVEAMSRRSYLLSPVNCLQALPWLPEEDSTVTCSRSKALEREDISFLSWDHPLVMGIMDAIVSSEFGNSSFALMDSDSPRILLEAVFVLECQAPGALHVDRFLSPVPIRILTDHHLKDLSNEYAPEKLRLLLRPGKKHLLESNSEIIAQLLPKMLDECRAIAERKSSEIIKSSREAMMRSFNAEIKRLLSLSKINPNIKEDDIRARAESMEQLCGYIDNSKKRLDSIRFILAQ